MNRQQTDFPDLAFGGFLILLAIVALVEIRNLSVGTAADMGPGYVPRALSCVILGFGLVIAGRAFLAKRRLLPGVKPRPILSVMISLAVFALLLPRGGLALATLATMACATFATPDYRWRESVLFAVIITVFTVLLFVSALGLPLSIWPRL